MALGNIGSGRLGGTGNDSGGRLAAILVALSIALFTLSSREGGTGPLSSVRNAFTVVTTPFDYLGLVVTRPVSGLANVFENLTADRATLSELEEENEELRARVAELEESEVTAENLQDLLDLRSTYELESTAATVISGSTDSWSSTITISKGSSAGLAVGMPVCSSTGVIGQIVECGTASSVVRLLTDEDSAIPAVVQSSRALGSVEGSADGSLTMAMVSTDEEVEVGDTVVTSGLGGVFPKGVPIGVVANVERPEGAVYYVISIDPVVRTDAVEEVLVITSITDEQRATEGEYDQPADEESSDGESSDGEGSSGQATADEG